MSVENISLFNSVLDEALERLGKKNLKLKECQYEAVKAVVVDRKDTICILPSGYGKSLICQLLPFVLLNYLFPTHAPYRRHTVFCMSITDYPRASVSFPRDRRLGERDWLLITNLSHMRRSDCNLPLRSTYERCAMLKIAGLICMCILLT